MIVATPAHGRFTFRTCEGQARARGIGASPARHDPGRVSSRVLAQVPIDGSRAPRAVRAWRSPDLLDALQAEVIRFKKRGIDDPFVYVDMRKWAPKWAKTDLADDAAVPEVSKDIRDLAKAVHWQPRATPRVAPHPRLRLRKWQA